MLASVMEEIPNAPPAYDQQNGDALLQRGPVLPPQMTDGNIGPRIRMILEGLRLIQDAQNLFQQASVMTSEPLEELASRRFLVTQESQSRLVVEMGTVEVVESASSVEDGSSVEDDGRDLLENESAAFD